MDRVVMQTDSGSSARSGIRAVRGVATALGDYASVLGARAASVLLSLVSVMISTHILHPVGYGLVAYVSLVGTLIFTITSAWTSTAVARFGREQLELAGRTNAVTWARIRLTAPLFLLAVVVVIVLWLVQGFPSDLGAEYLGLALVLGLFTITAEHMIYLLEATGRMRLSAVGILANQAVVVAAFAVILVTGFGDTPAVILCIMAASSFLLTVWFGALTWGSGLWPPVRDRVLDRRMLKFSVPLIAFTASQYVVSAVDLVVIRAFGSTAQVGIYAVAYRGYTVLQSLALASGPVLTPLFVSLQLAGRTDVLRRYVQRLVPQALFFGSTLLGLAVPLTRPLLPLLLGRGFADAVDPLIILLFANTLLFVAQLLGAILVLYERTRVIGSINVIAALVNVVADIVLIGVFRTGIIGAAVGTTLATLFICVGYVIAARHCVQSEARPNPVLIAPLVAAVLPALLLRGVLAAAVGIAGTLISFSLIMRICRPIGPQDRDLLEGLNIPGRVKRQLLRLTVAR